MKSMIEGSRIKNTFPIQPPSQLICIFTPRGMRMKKGKESQYLIQLLVIKTLPKITFLSWDWLGPWGTRTEATVSSWLREQPNNSRNISFNERSEHYLSCQKRIRLPEPTSKPRWVEKSSQPILCASTDYTHEYPEVYWWSNPLSQPHI